MSRLLNLGDCINCPECGSIDTYQYGTDEFDISEYDNTGHAYLDYHCKECNNNFRVYLEFNYEITEHYTR